jgi:hypothetical protein
MGLLRKIVGGIWAAFWAALLVAATVPAKVAVSNLASWADLTGASWLAHLVATRGADAITIVLSIVALLLAPVVAGVAVIRFRKLKEDGHTKNGLFYRFVKRDYVPNLGGRQDGA